MRSDYQEIFQRTTRKTSVLIMIYSLIIHRVIFRKKIKSLPLIKHNEKQRNVSHRPAALYSFDRLKYQELIKEGIYRFKM